MIDQPKKMKRGEKVLVRIGDNPERATFRRYDNSGLAIVVVSGSVVTIDPNLVVQNEGGAS